MKRKFFLLFICCISFLQQAFSQGHIFESDVESSYTSSTYLAGLPSPTYNDVLAPVIGVSYDSFAVNPARTDLVTKSAQDLVILGIRDTDLVIPAYEYSVTLNIVKYFPNGTTNSATTVVLHISYDPDSLKPYNDKSVFKFSGFHKFAVVVVDVKDVNGTTVPRNQLAKNFYIETVVSSQRYDKQNIFIYPRSTVVGNKLRVEWGTSRKEITNSDCPAITSNDIQPVEFDLEWTYIPDFTFDLANGTMAYPLSGQTDIPYNFRNNSTRVRVRKPIFDIPLIYERGIIVYRLRAVRPNDNNQQYRDLIYQNWNISDVGTVNRNHNCKAYTINTPHENGLNWQYSINFAEQGKYKHIINYYDGSLKSRQTQTKINTDTNYIVAVDRVYDFEGNKGLETIPVPIIKNDLGYVHDVALNNATGKQYKALDFDALTCARPDSFPRLSVSSLGSRYYSSSNPDRYKYQKFVPDAKGFPLTQSIYSPDKKILWQSGIGADLQLWTGRGTRFEYTRANQEELNKLFGAEAGLFQYYPKTITTDPNVQTSFAIQNTAGQTVATGLIGLPDTVSTPLKGIYAEDTEDEFCFDILGNGAQDRQSDGWSISTNFYVEKNANYSLQYRLKMPAFLENCQWLYANAYYEYSVTDECGRTVIPKVSDVLGDQFSSTSYFSSPLATANLTKGKYYVQKKLTFNKLEMFNSVKQHVKDNEDWCYFSEKHFIKFVVEQSGDFPCVTTPALGPCDLKKKKMLAEISPGGKYARYATNPDGSVDMDTVFLCHASPNPPSCPYIFVHNHSGQSIFQDQSGTAIMSCTPCGNFSVGRPRYKSPDLVMPAGVWKNGIYYTDIQNLPIDTLIYIWNDELAEAFLPLHPEYCQLKVCDDGTFITELESFGSQKQAVMGNRFRLDSIIHNDPIYIKADVGEKVTIKAMLRHFKNYPNETLEDMAMAAAYCSAGNPQESQHCAKHLYHDKIVGRIFVDSNIKQKYFDQLKSYYLINRSYVLQKLIDGAPNDCSPGDTFRIFNVEEPAVFTKVFTPDGQNIDPSLPIPSWIKDIYGDMSDPGTFPTNIPGQLQDSLNAIQSELDIARVDAVMEFLKNCSVDPNKLAEIRQNLIDAIANGSSIENPVTIQGAISVTPGVKLTDLCNGFLPNLKEFSTATDLEFSYDCKRQEYYDHLRDFFNKPEVIAAIKVTLQAGGPSYDVSLDAGNIFENDIAVKTSTAPSGLVTVNCFLDTIRTSLTTYHPIIKMKVTGKLSGLSTFFYLFNKKHTDNTIHGDPSLSLTVNSASCLNDDMTGSLNDGKLAQYTAMLEFERNDGINPSENLSFYIWGTDIPFMTSPQGKLPINCITCIDIKEALKTFDANYDTGNINRFNHPNTERHLANFLNYKLNANYSYSDYLDLMKACAVTDSVEIKKYFAIVKVECNSKSIADGFMTSLGNFSQLDLFDFRYQYPSQFTVIGLNFNQVTPDSLQFYKHSVLNIASTAGCTSEWLPEDSLKIFVSSGCTPSPGISTYGTFYNSNVKYYTSNESFTDGTLYTYNNAYTSPFQHSELLNDMYNLVAGCKSSFVLADAMLLRNEQYGTSISSGYLDYVYGLDGQSRFEVRDSISANNIKNRVDSFAGFELLYDDPYCSKSIRDLYLFDNSQGAHPGSVKLNYILSDVESKLGTDKLFLVNGSNSNYTNNNTMIYRKADGVHWYRHFDGDKNLWNVYLQPPANPPYSINTLLLDSVRIGPGTDSIQRFTAYMRYDGISGEVIECKGYTDFTLGYGRQLKNVVLFDKPGMDFCLDTIDCEYNKLQDLIASAKLMYLQAFNDTVNTKTERMFNHFINNAKDSLFMCSENQKNMITLYYYDLNGNLRKTVPPAGTATTPYTKITSFAYDSRNLKIKQETPDQGTSNFYYDGAGKLVFSQNSKQKTQGKFAYTLYDKQARPVETGEVTLATGQEIPVYVEHSYDNRLFPMETLAGYVRSRNRTDVMITTYDTFRVDLGAIAGEQLSPQEHLVGRVSSISYYPSLGNSQTALPQPEFSTHYSYDIVGNVKTVTYDCQPLQVSRQRYKRVDYDFDQLSGKVNVISYNRGRGDQFYQRYEYDADNRITKAETSNDGLIWNRDAEYIYYKHGPLANVKIGSKQVQSVDYAYTIQGWLKAINGDVLRPDKNMIGDSNILSNYARDVMAHTLNYFNGDYQAINSDGMVANFTGPAKNLYNGNITRTNTSIMGLENQRGTYTYDQANRLLGATYETVNESNLTVNTPSSIYKNSYEYDYDGNLQKLNRYDGNGTKIDSLLYRYYTNTNKLDRIEDRVGTTGGEGVQPNQVWGNYEYDGIGNLIRDSQAHLKMDWNLYGKLKTVEHTTTWPREKTSYYYDGLGNRIRKVQGKYIAGVGDVFKGEYYVRDATGNILATYRINNTFSKISLIDRVNSSIRTSPHYGPFINSIALPLGGYVVAFSARAISDMPGWVDTQTDKPISFYLLNGGGLYSEIMVGSSAPDYLNDLQQFSFSDPGLELFANAFASNPGNLHPIVDDVLNHSFEGKRMLRHFDQLMPEIMVDEMWGTLGVGSTRTPGAYVANANTLYNWMTMNNKKPELGSAMIDLLNMNISNDGGAESKNFFTAVMHDDLIFESIYLRSELPAPPTQFEHFTKEALFTGGNSTDIMNFFDQWGPPATDWLTTNTSQEFRMETVYAGDADNVLTDWLGNVSDVQILDTLLASMDEIGGFDYLRVREATEWVDKFGPPDYADAYIYALISDTTDLAEHHIYGSSRLGTQWYPAGTKREIYNRNPALPQSRMISDSTIWYSHVFADLINKGKKEPYGNEHTDTMYVRRTLGYRQYEMTDHLGNVLATILDRKTGYVHDGADTIAYYNPDIASSQDYYPFGMRMGGRHNEINDTIYRYGYNGQEQDNWMKGAFKHYDFKYRAYDPSIARFFSVDPIAQSYPYYSPYHFAGNTPIWARELEGLEPWYITTPDGDINGMKPVTYGPLSPDYLDKQGLKGDPFYQLPGVDIIEKRSPGTGSGWSQGITDGLTNAFRYIDRLLGHDNSALPPMNFEKDGGGIPFMSKFGQNQERRKVGHPDGQMESIDDLLDIAGGMGEGSGGIGLFDDRLQAIIDHINSVTILHQVGDAADGGHKFEDNDPNDTLLNFHDKSGNWNVIRVNKSEVGTKYITPNGNVTYTIEAQ